MSRAHRIWHLLLRPPVRMGHVLHPQKGRGLQTQTNGRVLQMGCETSEGTDMSDDDRKILAVGILLWLAASAAGAYLLITVMEYFL
jgi:hypothetical protein